MKEKIFEKLMKKLENNDELCKKEFEAGKRKYTLLFLDCVSSKQDIGLLVLRPLSEYGEFIPSLEFIGEKILTVADTKIISDENEALIKLFSGYILIYSSDENKILCADIKKYETRSVSPPDIEVSQYGSRESFVESINVNLSMLVRRLKTEELKIENITVGSNSNTRVCICYIDKKVSPDTVKKIKEKLENAKIRELLESGSLKEILEEKKYSFFDTVGMTVRPDICCSKICEGRVAVVCDNSPEVLFMPYLIIERFQTPDDYINRPFFALFSRVIKIISAVISTVCAGTYIALVQFNPEVFPAAILYNIIDNDFSTPFSVAVESVFLLLIYEMMREAGKRLPKSMGQSVSIVGSLVIGDAVVTAGIIGAPTVAVCAFAAISSFLVPEFYNQVAILRLLCIAVAVILGLYGVALFFTAVVIYICAQKSFGVPVLSPVVPFNKISVRDTVFRQNQKELSKFDAEIELLGKNGELINENF